MTGLLDRVWAARQASPLQSIHPGMSNGPIYLPTTCRIMTPGPEQALVSCPLGAARKLATTPGKPFGTSS
jgi:hypothetical protein